VFTLLVGQATHRQGYPVVYRPRFLPPNRLVVLVLSPLHFPLANLPVIPLLFPPISRVCGHHHRRLHTPLGIPCHSLQETHLDSRQLCLPQLLVIHPRHIRLHYHLKSRQERPHRSLRVSPRRFPQLFPQVVLPVSPRLFPLISRACNRRHLRRHSLRDSPLHSPSVTQLINRRLFLLGPRVVNPRDFQLDSPQTSLLENLHLSLRVPRHQSPPRLRL